MTKFKRIIAVTSLLFAGLSSASAFDNKGRIFDITFDTPVTVTNNTIGILDYLVPEVVIDLSDFVSQMPSEGFVFSTEVNPSVSANVYLFNKFRIGVDTGTSFYSRFGLSKDVFEFIANGNSPDEDLNITEKLDGYTDMFAYVNTSFGMSVADGKFDILVTPSIYTTVFHGVMNDSYVTAFNRQDSSFGFIINGNIDMYSVLPVSEEIMSADYWSNFSSYSANLWSALGLDISGAVTYNLMKDLKLTGSFRVPVIPSHLSGKTRITLKASMDTDVTEVASGTSAEIKPEVEFGTTETGDYIVNRPLKVFVQGDYSLLNKMIVCTAGLGLGYEHPFAAEGDEQGVYIDYLLQGRLNLIDIFHVTLATQCMDRIYSHSLSAGANLKFFEINLGGSLSSSTFSSSFRGTGLSTFVAVTVGL